ncbi:MAG TPA: TetR/AcrR family transcriptional regulator [Conexibacter sp.]|jgi:AcrR family transcriptional regulator|nr:TetR/AcrR family transcriptional regulator [Conexibacter sp.]
MPKPKQRTPELGEQVLAAALRIVERDGVAALTARRLAEEAGTSPPAVYELFGDKAGVVRAMFFAGFAQLGAQLGALRESEDPVEDLVALAHAYRGFIVEHPALAAVMFSRPFTSFDPAPEETAAGAAVRERIVGMVRRAIAAGRLRGDPTDVAHACVALVHGLAAAESARRLGGSAAAVERRWDVAVRALLRGFAADAQRTTR